MISIPVAVHNRNFQWQLDLFWFAHQAVYGARAQALAAIVTRNLPTEPEPPAEVFGWGIGVPFKVCKPYFETMVLGEHRGTQVPLNIQAALVQLLADMPDEQVIEVLDCDMYHFRPAPDLPVPDNVLFASPVYEEWHLKSRSSNRPVIDIYFEHHGGYYNGGFVPIIGRAGTFKKVMREWTAIHIDILGRQYGDSRRTSEVHWWAGMFALQAACEKARVAMIDHDVCIASPVNPLGPQHYISHYSVDPLVKKHEFPIHTRPEAFPDQAHYRVFKQWWDQTPLARTEDGRPLRHSVA